ncbi:hypothetical protein P8Q88_13015 [Qipengyuania sp. XHP0207]|uniref:hypothetical protein n=1 Tax=Qipengyuania sp. XHP0207 TaxID=3038078 RepID=UPI00241C8BA2|nr:hypothetical protein [Qipengyuania sp. XHP0207]MDG5749098.1 hypothetical protein [Qipengyuania sp. XHP0207]
MADTDPAAARFWLMQLLRLSGAVLVMIGAAIMAEAIDLPFAIGLLLVLLGLAEFFVVPRLLARRWRTPKE